MDPTHLAGVGTLLGGVAAACGILWRALRVMRTNDLAHLDAKTDAIHEAVIRVEGKIDRHLEHHAER